MFTVVVAEKIHIDHIQNDFNVYLKPVLRHKNIAFVKWNIEGMSLEEAVPGLKELVDRYDDWRLVVVCENKTAGKKNPFNVIPYEEPEFPENNKREDLYKDETFKIICNYFEEVKTRKYDAYEKASNEPLVRLMTWLSETPLFTERDVIINKPNIEDDYRVKAGRLTTQELEFKLYQDTLVRKTEIRKRIKDGIDLDIPYPKEVLCFALRTYKKEEYDIRTSWDNMDENIYSKFYDWNMYFDKMRYLIFDIVDENHRRYTNEYLRFFMTMLTIAGNELPSVALRPNRVYSIKSEEDKVAMEELFTGYDMKLNNTAAKLESELAFLRQTKGRTLSDKEAETVFCSNISVPVALKDEEVNVKELYAEPKNIGLSTDCSVDEDNAWHVKLNKTKKTITTMLRQQKRSVKRSITAMHETTVPSTDGALNLTDFQIDDIKEHTEKELLNMIRSKADNVQDTKRLDEDIEKLDKTIKDTIETRMTKMTTIVLAIVIVLLYAIGFIPLIINSAASVGSVAYSLILVILSSLVLLAIGFIFLFVLRAELTEKVKGFNHRMKQFEDNLESAMSKVSDFLSHTCNAMRGYYLLDYCDKNRNSETKNEKLLNKHISDIKERREEIRALFSRYLPKSDYYKADSESVDIYDYDFRREVDFDYPMPFPENKKGIIDFMIPGNKIEIPVRYLKSIYVRREELYD